MGDFITVWPKLASHINGHGFAWTTAAALVVISQPLVIVIKCDFANVTLVKHKHTL